MFWRKTGKGRRDRLERVGLAMIMSGPMLGITWSMVGITGGVSRMIGGALSAGAPVWPIMVVPFAFVGQMCVGIVIMNVGRRRSVELLVARRGCLCCECRYPLEKEVERGRCPECGTEYTLSAVKDEWRKTYPEMPAS